ncbi:SIMPL domain-containing protein [Sulfitobacter sp. BSw21498]|uniref:SIMPL domain-containing protein n=1 Tax=Sulfitobacter sp. BSw21498 TaxID=664426 RepID=UPI0020C7C64D|nr:SIMPL domain-containing protein [Sulfitobacter sp. BSw21498]
MRMLNMRIFKFAAILCAGFASGALAQQAPQGITVNGQGVVSIAPDTATIRLGVSERAASAAEAMAQTSEKVRGILDQLDSLKIAGLDRQTSGLYLRPVYDNGSRSDTTPVQVSGYEAGNTVSVTVRDLSKLGQLLDAVVAEGANDFNGLQFGLQDNEAALEQARKDAVSDAMARAQQLADAAGVKLGKVISMSETSQGFRPMEMRSAQMKSMDMPIETGEVDVSAQVSLQFEIVEAD